MRAGDHVFLRERYGFDRIPVPTEAFTVLIERDAAELGPVAESLRPQHDGFGVTYFFGQETACDTRANSGSVAGRSQSAADHARHTSMGTCCFTPGCTTSTILPPGPQPCYWRRLLPTARVVDWAEWQAGYARAHC